MGTTGATISIIIDKGALGKLIHSLEWRHPKYGWIEFMEKFEEKAPGGRFMWRVFLRSVKFPMAWDKHSAVLEYEYDKITKITLKDIDCSGWMEA